VLELDGHTVEVAHDGPRGIERSRGFRPDVVVCDIGLPGMSGDGVTLCAGKARRPRSMPRASTPRNPGGFVVCGLALPCR
jgi:CheY-like chemotaxis protein